jgi:hypothetical protein
MVPGTSAHQEEASVITRYRKWLVAILGMVLVAGILVDDATARRHPPSVVTGKIHGRRFRSRGTQRNQAVVAAFAFDPLLSLLSVGASKVGRLHLGALVRSVGITCPLYNYDPASATIPITLACVGNYHEMRLGHPELTKGWTTNTGIQVSLDAFDGARARGRWSGTFETPDPTNPADAPATVEKGRFDVVMTITNTSRTGGADSAR